MAQRNFWGRPVDFLASRIDWTYEARVGTPERFLVIYLTESFEFQPLPFIFSTAVPLEITFPPSQRDDYHLPCGACLCASAFVRQSRWLKTDGPTTSQRGFTETDTNTCSYTHLFPFAVYQRELEVFVFEGLVSPVCEDGGRVKDTHTHTYCLLCFVRSSTVPTPVMSRLKRLNGNRRSFWPFQKYDC